MQLNLALTMTSTPAVKKSVKCQRKSYTGLLSNPDNHDTTLLRRKAAKAYFLNKSERANSNDFWNTYRPFLHSKKSKQAKDITGRERRADQRQGGDILRNSSLFAATNIFLEGIMY